MKGSDEAGKHSGTGLVESHIRLSKLSMLKIKAHVTKAGLFVEDEDIGFEAGMAQNLVLGYSGVSPSMAALGLHPRGYYEFEDSSVTGIGNAAANSSDMFENAVRQRLLSLA